jgi:hypothetical protein
MSCQLITWKVYNGKIEVVFFVIESGRKLTIGVKFEVSVKTCGRVVSDLLSPILWRCIVMESTSQVINWQDMINIPDCALSSEIFYIINVFFRCILKLQKCFIPSVPCIEFIFHNSYITLELEAWNQTFIIPSVPCIEFIFHNSYITLELEVWNQTFIPSEGNVRVVKYTLYTRNGWYKSLISHFKLKGNVRVVKYKLYTRNGWYKSLISHFNLIGKYSVTWGMDDKRWY